MITYLKFRYRGKCEPDVAESVVDPARARPEGEVGRSGPDRRCCIRAQYHSDYRGGHGPDRPTCLRALRRRLPWQDRRKGMRLPFLYQNFRTTTRRAFRTEITAAQGRCLARHAPARPRQLAAKTQHDVRRGTHRRENGRRLIQLDRLSRKQVFDRRLERGLLKRIFVQFNFP